MLKLRIHVESQTAALFDGDRPLKVYCVSTAANGVGCEEGSCKTPLGNFVVSEKIGDGAPIGAVFKSRVATGEVWTDDPSNPLSGCKEDLVLTRILWLEGIDAHNLNTKSRYIYLHGTNAEASLGEAVSHGCVRFSNRDILELFELVGVGTPIEIKG